MKNYGWATIVVPLVAVAGLTGRPAAGAEPVAASELRAVRERAPRLTLGVNLQTDAVVMEGKALLVEATVTAGRDGTETVACVLTSTTRDWHDLVSIEVRDSSGRPIPALKITSIAKKEPSLVLNRGVVARLVWLVEAGEGRLLPPGKFTVMATLDSASPASTSTWRGKTVSPKSLITVKGAAEKLSENEARIQALVEIAIARQLGQPDAALKVADNCLADAPKDVDLLEAKGDILTDAGRHAEALAAYDAALANVVPQPVSPLQEIPELLLLKRAKAAKAAKQP